MAVGKNKRISKGKKGGKKKTCVGSGRERRAREGGESGAGEGGPPPPPAARDRPGLASRGTAPAPGTPDSAQRRSGWVDWRLCLPLGVEKGDHSPGPPAGLTPSPAALGLPPARAPPPAPPPPPSTSLHFFPPSPPLPHHSQDPFAKKDWYDVKAPSMFSTRSVGKTIVSRTQGTKIASDGLKGRVFEVSLADLQNNEADCYRKMRLRVEDVQGRNCLTNFWGMDFTTDKLRSMVRKWQTLIEAHVDVKTADGYILRLFALAFTKKRAGQVKKTCYAQSGQIRQIRKKMVEIMAREAGGSDLKELVGKFIPEAIGKEIEKACAGIFPLQNTAVRKVKILRAPKFDHAKLMEVHGDYSDEAAAAAAGAGVGSSIDRPVEGTGEPIPGAEPADE